MDEPIKQQIHQLIDQCDNVLLLEEIKLLLQSGKDWWDDLPDEDKNLVMESEAQYSKGLFISHEELMKRYENWRGQTNLTTAQKEALDKELTAINRDSSYLKKWDDIKGRFRIAQLQYIFNLSFQFISPVACFTK